MSGGRGSSGVLVRAAGERAVVGGCVSGPAWAARAASAVWAWTGGVCTIGGRGAVVGGCAVAPARAAIGGRCSDGLGGVGDRSASIFPAAAGADCGGEPVVPAVAAGFSNAGVAEAGGGAGRSRGGM